jgi:hypothetical protein
VQEQLQSQRQLIAALRMEVASVSTKKEEVEAARLADKERANATLQEVVTQKQSVFEELQVTLVCVYAPSLPHFLSLSLSACDFIFLFSNARVSSFVLASSLCETPAPPTPAVVDRTAPWHVHSPQAVRAAHYRLEREMEEKEASLEAKTAAAVSVAQKVALDAERVVRRANASRDEAVSCRCVRVSVALSLSLSTPT